MKKFILSLILATFLIVSPASAEFFPDIIVTSPNGIWTDSRAYTTLNAAITAVGVNERTIKIVSPQTVTTLTVPANVTLSFERDGSIANSGQLTINTKNIIAPNRQIFTGTGDIDFAPGSIVRTGWFSSAVEAFDVTNDDELTLIISKSAFITANCAVGDDVSLKWEASRNQLTANAGFTLSNIKNIEAGNYQLFAGAGDFDFLDGTQLWLKWFARLRSALNWVENEEVTIIVNEDSVVQASVASAANENIKVVPGGVFNLDAGVIFTLGSQIEAGNYQIFSGVGSPTFASGSKVKSAWFSGFEIAVTKIGTDNVELEVSAASNIANDCTINANTTLSIPSKGRVLTVANLKTLTINGPFDAGLYQVFSGDGSVAGLGIIKPEWFGAIGDGVTDDTTAINKAIRSVPAYRIIEFNPNANYVISDVGDTEVALTFNKSGMTIRFNSCTFSYGDDYTALLIGATTGNVVYWMTVEGFVRVRQTQTIAAVADMKGYGIMFRNTKIFRWEGSAHVYGFEIGYYFKGDGAGCTDCSFDNLASQSCKIDFLFKPVDSANSHVTEITIYNAFTTYDSGLFGALAAGTYFVQIVKNNRTANGIHFFGGVFQEAKFRKIYIADSEKNTFKNVYWDIPNGGTDIEIVGGAKFNVFSGPAIELQVISDSGTKNHFIIPDKFSIDKEGIVNFGQTGRGDLKLWTWQRDDFEFPQSYYLPVATSGMVFVSLSKEQTALGDDTTQWDITNEVGNTFRYTYDGTGTDPGVINVLMVEKGATVIITGGTFNALSKGTFIITGVGATWFEITNVGSVAEDNVTGTVTYGAAECGMWMVEANGNCVKVSGTSQTSDEGCLPGYLSVYDSGAEARIIQRIFGTGGAKVRVFYFYN